MRLLALEIKRVLKQNGHGFWIVASVLLAVFIGIYPNHICDCAKDGRIWKLRGNHWKGCNQLLQK